MKQLCLFLLIIGVNFNFTILGTRAMILPYQAQLLQNGFYKCAAAIISDTWLLTAAYCVNNHINYTWSVAAIGYYSACKKIIPHPKYRTTTAPRNDIALIKVQKPMFFYELQKPIALPTKSPKIYEMMAIATYGADDDLLIVNATVRKYKSCAINDEYFPKIKGTFCAYDDMELAKERTLDEGGLGVIDNKLAGILSSSNYSDIYTSVYKHLKWIKKRAKLPKKNYKSSKVFCKYYKLNSTIYCINWLNYKRIFLKVKKNK